MIRQAQVRDAEAVWQLLKQLGYEVQQSQVAQALGDDASLVLVYERSPQILGFIALTRYFYFPIAQTVTRITAFCVDEAHRSSGIGGQLLASVEALAQARGDAFVELTCALDREKAHGFYQRHGYSRQSYKFVKRFL